MPTIREVRDTFSNLIDRQKAVIDSMNAQARAVGADMKKADKTLSAAIAALLPSMDYEKLESLSAAAVKAGSDKDFARMARGFEEADLETKAHLKALDDQHGSKDTIAEQTRILERDERAKREEARGFLGKVTEHVANMSGITRYNRTHDEGISDSTRAYFQTLDRWKYITDGSYRDGYRLLKSYREDHGDYFRDIHSLKKETLSQGVAEKELTDLNKALSRKTAVLASYTELGKAYMGTDAILGTLRDTLQDEVLYNEAFLKAFPEQLESEATPVVTAVMKIKALNKLAEDMKAGAKQLGVTLQKLEEPMSKLNRGASRAGYKNVDVDLVKIEKSVDAQNAMARYRTVNAEKARQSISTFTPSSTDYSRHNYDSGSDMNTMLLWWLIMDSGSGPNVNAADPAYINSTIGVDDKAASELNLDVEALKPDIAGALSEGGGVLETFNASAPDFSSIDRDIGNFSVPEVTIDTGSIDTGSSYSYDSSPSFDCGGGCDGGGGGGGD